MAGKSRKSKRKAARKPMVKDAKLMSAANKRASVREAAHQKAQAVGISKLRSLHADDSKRMAAARKRAGSK